MKCRQSSPLRLTATIPFVLVVFLVLLVVFLMVSLALVLMVRLGLIVPEPSRFPIIQIMLTVFSIASLLIGIGIAAFAGAGPVKVFLGLRDGMQKLESGDFKTRISLGHGKLGENVSRSFNALAEELEHTEMLRTDFINNFSHEFKTPIVSIYGFAQLLRQGNLTTEEQQEYTRIIEEESRRLSILATNVLNLTMVENQEILTGVTGFNLAEQLRTCILLLEPKWSEKELDLDLNLPETEICGNEELLKEVWINLLDNAVKFSDPGGELVVRLMVADQIQVQIENHGACISEESISRIFQKFYQADSSRANAGNGIGLAIVKRIVELHHGTVSVSSDRYRTVFTVTLPT